MGGGCVGARCHGSKRLVEMGCLFLCCLCATCIVRLFGPVPSQKGEKDRSYLPRYSPFVSTTFFHDPSACFAQVVWLTSRSVMTLPVLASVCVQAMV